MAVIGVCEVCLRINYFFATFTIVTTNLYFFFANYFAYSEIIPNFAPNRWHMASAEVASETFEEIQ
jgi:hypothetical protein